MASSYRSLLIKLSVLHLSASFVAFYREVYEANMQTTGIIMRFAQIVIIVFQLFNILTIAAQLFDKLIYSIDQFYAFDHGVAHPKCYEDHDLFNQWQGRSLHWLTIEIIVEVAYVCTFVIFLIKSRFMRIQ